MEKKQNIKSPLFSILIANFNNGKFIEEAINSVLVQSYTNWEIIIVDDHSNDNSIKILEKYKNNDSIKIFTNDKNKGCGYTKNKCVELASGEIAGFLDPDDKLTKKALEVMIEMHNMNDVSSLIYSSQYICNETMDVQEVSTYPSQITNDTTYLEQPCGRVSHFATFKLRLYNKTEGINKQFKRAVDQDLYYKLEEVGT